jgi:hypothetical protein
MLKRFFIICFLTIVFIIPSILLATKIELRITKPENSDKITERKIAVEGTSKGLDSGAIITIYVRTNQVYEQGKTEIKSNGKWRFYPAFIGAEEDKEFHADIYAETESGIRSNIVTVYRVR